jgi:hypothetical protein
MVYLKFYRHSFVIAGGKRKLMKRKVSAYLGISKFERKKM